jgi:KaiC/GvpD/RAD55 family RecA-like ATPase
MGSRLSTGISVLDKRLDGGLPPGSLVALTTPADAQSQLLVRALARERETLYLTTVRPEEEIRAEFGDERTLTPVYARPDALLGQPETHLDRVSAGTNVVVDTVDELERGDRDRYLSLLNGLKGRLQAAEGVGVLRCLAETDTDHRKLTLDRADLVWRLELDVTEEAIETRLVVSKFREGRALQEPIKLDLTDEVSVDTSRDIG